MATVDIVKGMEAIAADSNVPPESRAMAKRLAAMQESAPAATLRDEPVNVAMPIDHEFAALYMDAWSHGHAVAGRSKVVFVGMGRDVEKQLPYTFRFIERVGRQFRDWAAVIVENDSTDNTKAILNGYAKQYAGRVTVECENFGRERLRGFEQQRVERYAEYRNRYSDIARELHGDADYVVAIDTDPESISSHGIINGLGWLHAFDKAAGMASLSLFQHRLFENVETPQWCHYDQWAFRWQSWQPRIEPWFTMWVPQPGAPPIRVLSAFGAACIYKAQPFYKARYSSVGGDIEHVGLHREMHQAGWELYLNPAQRCLMHWMPKDAGQHGND
jgi:hypothetical protein